MSKSWEEIKEGWNNERKAKGIVRYEVSCMAGSTIEECYNFMQWTKISKERLNEEYYVVFINFNNKEINTDMSLEECWIHLTGLNEKDWKLKYKM